MADHKTFEELDYQFENPQLKEVLSKEPLWIIRYGLVLILLIVILLIVGSYLFKYPEVIEGRAKITTESPPVRIVSETGGRIEQLFVGNHQPINAGDTLLLIDNATNFQHLKSIYGSFGYFYEKIIQDTVVDISFNSKVDLGEYQSFYNQLITDYNEYHNHTTNSLYRINAQNLETEISSLKILYDKKSLLNGLLGQEIEIAQGNLDINKKLYEQGAIASLDFDKTQAEYLTKQQRLINSEIDVINTKVQLESKEKELDKLTQEFKLKQLEILLSLKKASMSFMTQLNQWKKKYLLISPISGTVSFLDYWSENQVVSPHQEILTIIPQSQDIFGYCDLALSGYGKIQNGQKVLLKMDGFPYQEYGTIEASVRNKAQINRNGSYRVILEMPKGLVTNYGEKITFTQEMEGNAEIITEDLRLIERLLYQLLSVYKN